ncbi:tRNA synthetase [Oryctes borbonicus]|uniref:valine--tRNA ligase n=1 Tax=Oryctes borbonicus TaxID=1629725 RepID=A0A0T6BE15_9SCAR|nr:tRNA synthetase [Oryctes borbonicus]
MRGLETFWIPGIDHAGIATQLVVEKKIWKERKQTKNDLGREQFLKEIMEWKDDKANTIGQQLKQMGASLDWSKQIFTMDPAHSYAVTEAFIKLFDCGLIYRSDYLVNWSCALGTAISDIEVQHLKISEPTTVSVPGYDKPVKFGILTKFAYKLCDSDGEIVVATTRPETMLGDTAIAVHPNDERYTSFIGQICWHPFRNEKISIISDELVDPQFGTGAVKVTPGHDHVDFEIAKRHNLNLLHVIDEKGYINSTQFKGIPRFDARDIIVDELHRLKLLRGQQEHEMVVPTCSRSNDVVEFLLKPQWFLRCTNIAQKALNAVKDGSLEIEPKNFVKDWNNWLGNIRDWCISRQLWWGHRIPIYSCHIEGEQNTYCVAASSLETAKIKGGIKLGCESNRIIAVQDEDVLDTWFSSALLPFSAFGWPNDDELNRYYPLSLMETGHDILFFWVARMVMLGMQLTGKLPFSKVLLHGIIRDGEGRKMSKSLGNVIAPEDVILGRSLQCRPKPKLSRKYQNKIFWMVEKCDSFG